MKSVEQMLSQCEGLTGTKDVSSWENSFIQNCAAQLKRGGSSSLSSAQLTCIENIWKKHFA